MKTYFDCYPCFIKQALDALKEVTDDEALIAEALKKVLYQASLFDMNLSPPEMGEKIHQIIRETTGNKDPYKEIKKRSIEMAKKLMPMAKEQIKTANDPFDMAVRFAIAGNIMDFALISTWDDERIKDSFVKASFYNVNADEVASLKKQIMNSKTVLVLGDNAGESVFDKLLIDTFPEHVAVTYAVKASPVINDAVLEDAINSGLKEVAKIIDNGSQAPGTVLSQCSDDFKKIYQQADTVVAKGQANFETLNQADREIYFLTQIKCPVIARHYDYKVGDWIVSSKSSLKNKERGE